MAHECPDCGQQCYCDMDDTGGMPVPDEHILDHECEHDDDVSADED